MKKILSQLTNLLRRPKKSRKNLVIGLVILLSLMGLALGMALAWWVFNSRLQAVDRYVEVTFINPHQALVFWKSESSSLGFVKSGSLKYYRPDVTYQTSSEPGDIHAVLLEEIPPEGLYISVHNEADSAYYRPTIIKINYQPEFLE